MKLICISNGGTYNENTRLNITIGKVYDGVIEEKYGRYLVTREDGSVRSYSNKCVIPLDEWRERKLKEIGI
jgi:hypothetical protein